MIMCDDVDGCNDVAQCNFTLPCGAPRQARDMAVLASCGGLAQCGTCIHVMCSHGACATRNVLDVTGDGETHTPQATSAGGGGAAAGTRCVAKKVGPMPA